MIDERSGHADTSGGEPRFRPRRLRRTATIAAALLAAVALLGAAVWFVVVPSYRPPLRRGERYGIDVARHQGTIDWRAVAADDIGFAYLKATEGGDHADERFHANRTAARAVGIRTGAYHFFTFCRSGAEQAANFLRVVGDDPEQLPPALDLEYAGNCSRRPSADELRREVTAFIRIVEATTRRPVILYVLDDTEHDYRVRATTAGPLWSRRYPWRPSSPRWIVWQLHGFAHVDGVEGSVDLDVAPLPRLASLQADVTP